MTRMGADENAQQVLIRVHPRHPRFIGFFSWRHERPASWKFALPPAKRALAQGMKFHVDIPDTWKIN
jgi:hypothetical protein